MREYVTINGENYKTESVVTGVDTIRFTLADMKMTTAVEKFKGTTDLSISGEDLKPYGVYSNLTFNSATADADGLVTVVFHIARPEEIRLAALEKSQAEQDNAIAELLGGEE